MSSVEERKKGKKKKASEKEEIDERLEVPVLQVLEYKCRSCIVEDALRVI